MYVCIVLLWRQNSLRSNMEGDRLSFQVILGFEWIAALICYKIIWSYLNKKPLGRTFQSILFEFLVIIFKKVIFFRNANFVWFNDKRLHFCGSLCIDGINFVTFEILENDFRSCPSYNLVSIFFGRRFLWTNILHFCLSVLQYFSHESSESCWRIIHSLSFEVRT